jgi:lipid-binding SYLF domain-containing protein
MTIVSVVCLVASASPGAAEDSWKDLKTDAKRAKIDEAAKQALDEVFAKSDNAEALYDKAYGWAGFDNLKLALGWSGGGGNGVAVDKESGARTYMKMGTVGVGLGIGAQKYQVIFLFQDEQTFRSFVDKGWEASASAQAAAGTEGVGGQTGFVNGIAIYQVTDKGLMASADVAGTKYWKNKKLNR